MLKNFFLCFPKHSDQLWFMALCHSHFTYIIYHSDFIPGSTRSEGPCLCLWHQYDYDSIIIPQVSWGYALFVLVVFICLLLSFGVSLLQKVTLGSYLFSNYSWFLCILNFRSVSKIDSQLHICFRIFSVCPLCLFMFTLNLTSSCPCYS